MNRFKEENDRLVFLDNEGFKLRIFNRIIDCGIERGFNVNFDKRIISVRRSLTKRECLQLGIKIGLEMARVAS
jgi:hypothetical protein